MTTSRNIRFLAFANVFGMCLWIFSLRIMAQEYSEEVRNSHIILYEHAGFQGAHQTLRLSDGGYQEIDPHNILHGRCSSFELNCPPNVMVTLCKHLEGQDGFDRDRKNYRPPDHRVDQPALDNDKLNDAIKSIVWAVDNRQVAGKSKTGAEDDANRPPDPPRSKGFGGTIVKIVTQPTKVLVEKTQELQEKVTTVLPKTKHVETTLLEQKNKIKSVVDSLTSPQDIAAKIAALEQVSLDDIASSSEIADIETEWNKLADSVANLTKGTNLLDLSEADLKSLKDKADNLTQPIKKSFEKTDALRKISALQKQALANLKALAELENNLKVPTVEELAGMLDKLLPSREYPVFSLDTPLTLGFNSVALTHFGEVTLPQGMRYNYEQLKRAFGGDASLPDIDWLQCMAEVATGLKPTFERKWERLDAALAAGDLRGRYFSSERWTKYASIETIGSVAAKIYASGGDGAKDAARNLEMQCRLELSDLLAWAKLEGHENLPALAALGLKRLRNLDSWGKDVEKDESVKITLIGAQVNYQLSEFGSASSPYAAILSPTFTALQKKGLLQWEEKVKLPHFGFVIETEVPGTRGENPANRLRKLVDVLEKPGQGREIQETINKAFELVSPTSGNQGAKYTQDLVNSADITDVFKQVIEDIKTKAKDRSQPIHWKVDLSKSAVAGTLAEKARKLALGNVKEARVEVLTLDLATGRIDAVVKLTHGYKWTGFRSALSDIETAMKRADAVTILKDNASDMLLDAIFGTAPPGSRELVSQLRNAVKVKVLRGRISSIEREVASLFKRF